VVNLEYFPTTPLVDMVMCVIMRDDRSEFHPKEIFKSKYISDNADRHGGSHPLLAQIPLTVSPFISLPTATTLPYTYKTLPSTLPPSSTGSTATATDEKAKYVVSASGHAAHPDDIIASCKALQEYLRKVQDDADRVLNAWEESIKARELAEKRRVAPGWLDSDARLLEPQRKDDHKVGQKAITEVRTSSIDSNVLRPEGSVLRGRNNEGEELDRAFGGLELR
jgi:hypothetical protein